MKTENHLNVNQKADYYYVWLEVLQVLALADFTFIDIFLSHRKKTKRKERKFEGWIERFPLALSIILRVFAHVVIEGSGIIASKALCHVHFHFAIQMSCFS